MKNYFKLLDLLFSVSDCVAFEVEAYENIYFKISEGEIINLFNKYIKNYLTNLKNEEKEFIKYKKRIIKNEENNKKQIISCLNSFANIKKDIIFKYLSFEFGANMYSQESRNLILGFNISANVKKYLYSAKDVFDWKGKRQSNTIFVSDKKVLQELRKLKYPCYYKSSNEFYNINYPYEINDDNKILI